MRRIFSVIGVILLLVLLELSGRGCSNSLASGSIKSRFDNAGKVTVQSGDAPFLVYELGLGYLKNGSVTVHDVVASPVSISSLSMSAEKLRLSRGSLVGGTAKITGDGPYRIVAVLDAEDVRRSVNAPVRFHNRYVQTSVKGTTIDAKPVIKGDKIVLTDDDGATVSVPIPGTEYLPCTPTRVDVQNALVLRCVSATMPKAFSEAVS